MLLTVADIAALDGLPRSKRGIQKWLKASGVPTRQDGKRFVLSLLDLPEDVQLAYRLRLTEEAGLVFGEQDDAAH